MALFELKNVTKRYHYDKQDTISDLTFAINNGEVATLMAEVQSGKTTVAKLLMGIEKPTSGEMLYDGQPYKLSPIDKGICYFCDKPLYFKHKTVKYNLSYPLAIRRTPKQTLTAAVEEVAAQYALDLSAKACKLSEDALYNMLCARCALRPASLIILDSLPDAYFDKMYNFALSRKCAILILTANIKQARGKVSIMQDKRIIHVGDTASAQQLLEQIFWLI